MSTVKFNVGGRVFEMLREPTLSLHPTSLLYQMAEDWDEKEPIFVEASPEIFPYIVEYHRHRKIILPATVPKASVIREGGALGLSITEADIEQDLPTMETVARKAEGVKMSSVESRSKALADLVIKHAMIKAAQGGGQFYIGWSELKQEGTEIVCKGAAEHSGSPCVPTNTFEFTLKFLTNGVDKSEHAEILNSWAKPNGYKVQINGQSPNTFPATQSLVYTFSPLPAQVS